MISWLTGITQHHDRGLSHLSLVLGKDQTLKFKIQFPWNAYHFCIIVKSKDCKLCHQKLRTICRGKLICSHGDRKVLSGSGLGPTVRALPGLRWSWGPGALYWCSCNHVWCLGHLLLAFIISAISFPFQVLTLWGLFVQIPRFCLATGFSRTSLVPSGTSRNS